LFQHYTDKWRFDKIAFSCSHCSDKVRKYPIVIVGCVQEICKTNVSICHFHLALLNRVPCLSVSYVDYLHGAFAFNLLHSVRHSLTIHQRFRPFFWIKNIFKLKIFSRYDDIDPLIFNPFSRKEQIKNELFVFIFAWKGWFWNIKNLTYRYRSKNNFVGPKKNNYIEFSNWSLEYHNCLHCKHCSSFLNFLHICFDNTIKWFSDLYLSLRKKMAKYKCYFISFNIYSIYEQIWL